MNTTRNIFRGVIAAAMLAALVSCSSGPTTSTSFNNDVGSSITNPIQASIKYIEVPDGRVFECIVSTTYNGYSVTDCNWDHPVAGTR